MQRDKFTLSQSFIRVLTKMMVENDLARFTRLTTSLIVTLEELEEVCNDREMQAFYDALKTAGWEMSR